MLIRRVLDRNGNIKREVYINPEYIVSVSKRATDENNTYYIYNIEMTDGIVHTVDEEFYDNIVSYLISKLTNN